MFLDFFTRFFSPVPTVRAAAAPDGTPSLLVQGYAGDTCQPGTPAHQALGVHRTLTSSLARCQELLTEPIRGWSSGGTLTAIPRAGRMLNAFYDRWSLSYFFDTDPVLKKDLYLADLPDVVAHELGHALLDALRPDLWAVQSVEIQAAHEAFGDINSLLHALSDPALVADMLSEVGGDVRKSSVVSRIAEEMQVAILHSRGETPEGLVSLRDASNSLVYVQPEGLPTKVPGGGLAGEPHNFSRVFLGGWWSSLAGIYERERSRHEPVVAVGVARDLMARITLNGVRTAPVTPRFFGSILTAMLAWDELAGTGCREELLAGFGKHGIVPAKVTPMAPPPTGALFATLGSGTDTVRVGDWEPGTDPLHSVIVELPNLRLQGYHATDSRDLLDSIQAAKHSLAVIRDHGRVGMERDPHHEFSVVDGRLVRNHYSCWFSPRSGRRCGRHGRRRWPR